MLQGFSAKILNYHREYGLKKLIGKCLITLFNALFFYKKEVVGCISVIDSNFCSRPKIPVTIRAALKSDIPELEILARGYKKRDFLNWVNDGHIFYIAQLKKPEKKIVGYVCVCRANKSRHKIVSMLKLKDTDYWAVDAYIHPDYRGEGINSAIASGLLTQAKREGYKRGYGTITFSNNASRKSYAVVGEKEIGLFTTMTVMGLTFHFLKRKTGYEEFFI
jgi:GNAT superfamily N-acetyltransferase